MRSLASLARPAEKSAKYARVGLYGASNAGKTFTSLQLARGFGGDFCVIDTETRGDPPIGRSNHYANILCATGKPFSVIEVGPPFDPNLLLQLPDLVRELGVTTVVIDSLSRFWQEEGGFLSKVDEANGRNAFDGWRRMTPFYNKVIETIMTAPCHVITTLRAKTSYETSENDRGKKTMTKVGTVPQFKDSFIYALDFSFLMDADHTAHVDKHVDTLGLFEDASGYKSFAKPGAELAKLILQSLGDSKPAARGMAAMMQARIRSCRSTDELTPIAGELRALPEDVRAACREVYAAQLEAVRVVQAAPPEVVEALNNEVPERNPDPHADRVVELIERIGMAETTEAIQALGASIRNEPQEIKDAVRAAFNAQKAAVQQRAQS